MQHSSIKKNGTICIFLLIFFLLYVFFYRTAPFIPFIHDDWVYFAVSRSFLPASTAWNPARVLPELMEPLTGQVAAFLVMPLTGDYLEAVRLTTSALAALCIVCLCAALERFLRKFTGSRAYSLSSALLFLGMAFCLFKIGNNSFYLFYNWALMIFFFYSIPNFFNSILVILFLYIQYSGSKFLAEHKYRLGFIVVFIYLAQFSMTTASLISAVMAGILLVIRMALRPEQGVLQKIYSSLRHPEPLDILLWFTLLCWVSAAVLDMRGARYAWYGDLPFRWDEAVKQLCHLLEGVRKPVILISLFTCCGTICTLLFRNVFKKRSERRGREYFLGYISLASIFSFVSMAILIICISAKTEPGYAEMIQFCYGIFFYLLLLTVLCFSYLLKKFPILRIAVPFILCWFFFDATRSTIPYPRPITDEQIQTVNEWLTEARHASASGAESISIPVPKEFMFWSEEGHFAKCFAKAIFDAGITTRILTVHFRPDPSKKFLGFPPAYYQRLFTQTE